MGLTVAIVGRPNVGKSTLFNRLIGRRVALVDDAPGVTRDRRADEARIGDFRFTVVDTAGLDDVAGASLAGRMRRQTEQAVLNADLVLFLIDARAGVMPLDEHYANWLRKAGRPVILLANKAEGRAAEPGIAEAFGLGFGEPVAISAEHGDGMAELYAAITQMPDDGAAEQPSAEAAGEPEKPLQLAIVGRPNVGKSTLVNRLIGEERLLTGPEPGITRDAIAVAWRHRGRRIRLIDTAGLRRRPHVVDKLEKLSVEDALRGIRFAQVVILVIDANNMLEKQDLAIARLVVEEGRAMVVAANKWDIVEDKAAAGERLRDRLEVSLPQSRGIAVVMISAHTGYNVDRLLDAALAAYDVWNRRVATPEVNRWLEAMVGAHPPPLVRGRRIKLRYMAQIKTRPPTFALFGNQLDQLPDAYLRYLESGLRERFDLPGVPIRLQVRRGKNPYVDRS